MVRMSDTDENVLLMFSGGIESILSVIRLNKMYPEHRINLITYDNGCTKNFDIIDNAIDGLKNIKKLGIYNIAGVIREFYNPYFNMTAKELAEKYPGLTVSQFHCLICKTAMYLTTCWFAKANNITIIANGAREAQNFITEQADMITRFKNLVEMFDLSIEFPVYDVDNDWELENELLRFDIIPKVSKPKCLIKCPQKEELNYNQIESLTNYYDTEILPHIKKLGFLNETIYKNFV